MSTQDVLNHHLQSFAAGDAEELVKDYTDESVLLTPDGPVKGREALQAAFAGFFDGIFKPGTYDFSMDKSEVIDDVAYIVWHATTSAGDVPLGTDTFIVRDGKIALQTFAMHLNAK
jgi:ketosteroid isomerase-like protein